MTDLGHSVKFFVPEPSEEWRYDFRKAMEKHFGGCQNASSVIGMIPMGGMTWHLISTGDDQNDNIRDVINISKYDDEAKI